MLRQILPAFSSSARHPHCATQISLLYLACGLVYVLVPIQGSIPASPLTAELADRALLKSGAFVLVTSALLFALLRRRERILSGALADLADRDRRLALAADHHARALEAATVLHDLNNTLQALLGALDEGATPSDARAADQGPQGRISSAADACLGLARELGRLLHDRNDAPTEELDVAAHAHKIERLLSRHADGAQCQLEIDADLHAVVVARPADLTQILLNLTLNAAQAAGPGGRVRITCRASEEHIHVTVDDDGPGITAEVAASLFQPGVSTKPRGSGLGLVAVRHAVERMAGSLAHGPSPLGGARFEVSLPRALNLSAG